MFTRLKVAWWALLGRPIIYRVEIVLGCSWKDMHDGSVLTTGKHRGPVHLCESTLTGPPG